MAPKRVCGWCGVEYESGSGLVVLGVCPRCELDADQAWHMNDSSPSDED